MLENYCKPWTAEEEQFIRDNPRMTASELAEKLGRSKAGIRTRRFELNERYVLSYTPLTNDEELKVIREHINTAPVAVIGRMIHRSAAYVREACDKNGIQRKKRLSSDEHERIVGLFMQGFTRHQIADMTGRSYPCVARHIGLRDA